MPDESIGGTVSVSVYEDAEAVARAAAERFVALARESAQAHGRFSIALSGGSTPKRVYELLASENFRDRIDWSKTHLFFGDERCVPPDNSESNFRMAREALISRVPVPAENVHRMIGEGDAAANARLYEDELRVFFGASDFPTFDLVMLGMGDDGHTASLFPGTDALAEERAWVVANWVEKFKTFRITLTAPAINHAAHVLFLVTGGGKAERLAEVNKGPRDPRRLPSQLIRPVRGELSWYVDRAAAAKLKRAATDNSV